MRRFLQHFYGQAFFQRFSRYPACLLAFGQHNRQCTMLILHEHLGHHARIVQCLLITLEPTDRVTGKSPTDNPIRTSPSRILIGTCSPDPTTRRMSYDYTPSILHGPVFLIEPLAMPSSSHLLRLSQWLCLQLGTLRFESPADDTPH